MKNKGFTLVELMVVVAMIGILAAILLPSVTGMTTKAKASKMTSLIQTLRTACTAHFIDTGLYAQEWSNDAWTSVDAHQLSVRQSYYGWNGPYLQFSLAKSHSGVPPANNWLVVYNNLPTWNADSGYDLNRDGVVDRSGAGNFVHNEYFNDEIAALVETVIDGPPSGNWMTSGVVEYRDDVWGNTLQVYLTGGS